MSGELRASATQFGVALGMLVALVAVCAALCMKRARRLRQIANRSGSKASAYTA